MKRAKIHISPSLNKIILIISILNFSTICFAAEDLEWYKEPINHYKEGRLAVAKEILKKELEKSDNPRHTFYVLDLLAQQCINTMDWPCIFEVNEKITPLFDQVLDKQQSSIYKLWYASVFISSLPEIEQLKLKLPPETLTNIGWMLNIDSFRYAGIQLRSARILRNQRRYEEASEALKRAIYAFYLIPTTNWYDISVTLMNIVDELVDQGEVYKSFKWLYSAEPYLETVLVHNSPEYSRFKVMKAKLATGVFNISPALVDLYKEAYNRVKSVGYNDNVREFALGEVTSEYATVALLNGQNEEALKIIETHPLNKSKEEILQGRHNASPIVIGFASAYIMINYNAGKEIDPRWEAVLSRAKNKNDDIKWEDYNSDFTEYARDYIDFALGVIKYKKNNKDGANLFSSSAKGRINNLKKTRERFSDSFPLINIWDRVLVEFGILSGIDTKDVDLVITGSEVLDRNYQSYLTDSKSVIAAQDDEAKRQISRNWLRRVSQRNDFEINQLAAFLEQSIRRQNFDEKEQTNNRIIYATELEIEKEERKSINGLTDNPFLPSLSRLQSTLKDNEVFIKITFAAGKLVHFCVKKESYLIPAAKIIDSQKFFLALKSIENSLNYSGQPDLAGASFYPVSDAKYVWHTLMEDLVGCVNNTDNMIISVPPILKGIPFEALIRETDKGQNNNLEELEKEWVGVNWGIAYSDSVQSHIISREIGAKNNLTKIPYLGIGNPKLTKEKNIASNDLSIRGYIQGSSSPVNFNLEELGNLPSTHEELKLLSESFSANKDISSKKIGNISDVLELDNATELEFRSKTLSMYNIIHFATHALIREELPGIKEPSLVLTPNSLGNDINNGLLTVSEISKLDLNANIIILSACNTAKADPQLFGGGLSGLSNAFSFAGVPTIIASLWEINDVATKDLISYYGKKIQESSSNSIYQIHQSSIRDYIVKNHGKVFIHPRFWASVIILGDGSLPFIEEMDRNHIKLKKEFVKKTEISEIFDIVNYNSNFITIQRAQKKLEQDKYSFTTQAIDLQGNTIWKPQGPEFSAGKLSIGTKGVFVLGYTEGGIVRPKVQVLDKQTGKLNYTYASEKNEGIPVSFYSTDFTDHLYWFDLKKSTWNVDIYDRFGVYLRSQEIYKHSEKYQPGSIFTIKLKNSDVILVEPDITTKNLSTNINQFGLLPTCYLQYSTKLYFYNEKANNIIKNIKVDDYLVYSARETQNGEILLSGMKNALCSRIGTASVLLLDKVGIHKEIWSDLYAPSIIKASFLKKNGELYLFEEKNEAIELFIKDSINHRLSSIVQDNLPTINSTKTKSVMNIIKKNINTGDVDQSLVASGLSDKFYGVIGNENEFTVYGSRGGHPHIMIYSSQ